MTEEELKAIEREYEAALESQIAYDCYMDDHAGDIRALIAEVRRLRAAGDAKIVTVTCGKCGYSYKTNAPFNPQLMDAPFPCPYCLSPPPPETCRRVCKDACHHLPDCLHG